MTMKKKDKKLIAKNLQGKRFSKDYQPSPEKKSEGQKKSWEYRRARQQFFEKMCDVELPDGSRIDFWDEVKKRFHAMLLDKKSTLKDTEKANLMIQLCKEFMPEMKMLNVDTTRPIVIKLDSDDEKL